MNVLVALAAFDASLPDGQMCALADAPGVDRRSIRTESVPKRGGHGHHVVRWSQDGRNWSAEGSTLSIALGRAVRAAGGVSAPVVIDEGDDA